MQHLTCNITGNARRDFIGPHEYLIVPVTMIVPGVLNGNRGPILYTADENKRDPSAWNHIPLTDDHPAENVSARSPQVLKSKWLGLLLNAHTDGTGSLKGEAWFDVKATEQARPGYIRRIENGEKVELSTGLGMDVEDAPGTTANGQSYGKIAKAYRPDHLAILFEKPGACSIRDGCGVNNCKSKTMCEQCKKQADNSADADAEDGHDNEAATITTTNSKDSTMAEFTRKSVIAGLIKNCEAWTEDDEDTLNAMSDDQLRRLAKAETTHVANAKALAKIEAENSASDTLPGNADDTLPGDAKDSTQNAEPMTDEQWFNAAPAGVRAVFNHARTLQEKHRAELVTKLVANASAEQKDGLTAVYKNMDIAALETLVSAIPEKAPEPVQNFFGQVPASHTNNAGKTDPIPQLPPLFG